MNKLTIIGRLTRDPELRTTQDGTNVCGFTVAVNRRTRRDAQNQPEADFFRVSAWRQLGENCARFLSKGKMVAVVGSVSVRTYQTTEGETRASLEVNADDVEFLTPKSEGETGSYSAPATAPAPSAETQAAGFTAVETDELPF
jgi:single-strand DNA-binding protein